MKKILITLFLLGSLLAVPLVINADTDIDAQFVVVQNLKNDISSLVSQLNTKLSSLQTELDNLHTIVNSKLAGGGGGGGGSLTTNLEHYYALTSNSNDSVGTDHGTDTNVSHSSSGADFTSTSSSKISLGTPIAMPTNLTVSAFIHYNYTGGTQPIFADSNVTITNFWYFFVTGNNIAMIYETPSGSRGYETNGEVINSNPHCVSVTQSGTDEPLFYVDGALIAHHTIENINSNTKPTAQGSAIGTLGAANFIYWHGVMKNVGIWSRALSATEEGQLNTNNCGI